MNETRNMYEAQVCITPVLLVLRGGMRAVADDVWAVGEKRALISGKTPQPHKTLLTTNTTIGIFS